MGAVVVAVAVAVAVPVPVPVVVVVVVVLARAFTMSLATDASSFSSLTTNHTPKAVAQHLGNHPS